MKSEFAKSCLSLLLIMAAFLLIMYGIQNKEVLTVFRKAINICMECIGIG